jgi:hypothetical protein
MDALRAWGSTFKADKAGLVLTIHNMVLFRLWVYCDMALRLCRLVVVLVRRRVCGDGV